MISLSRFKGMRIRAAAAVCVSPAGLRNSSSSIAPGAVGGRFRSSTERGPLVVVLAHNVVDMAVLLET
jgi:hypothetical protein